mgnify:CR=1 FL=1
MWRVIIAVCWPDATALPAFIVDYSVESLGAQLGFALGPAEEAPAEEDAASDDEEADEIDPDFDPDDDVTMRDPEPTSRKRKAPPAPRPKRRRKTKAAPVEPVLSEYELGRRAKIKRNNKFLVSVGLLFPR